MGRPTAARWRASRSAVGRRRQPQPDRQPEGQDHADGHASPCSSRVGEAASASRAWPKVWPRLSRARSPALALVARRRCRAFIRQRVGDGVAQRGVVAGHHRLGPCASSQAKNSASPRAPYLTTSRVAGQQLAARQGGQRAGVGQHQARLVEGADQVLALAGVDAGLAAHRGVDLGQQRGGDLCKSSPRLQMPAAKPVRSPITPPPRATIRSPRSQPRASSMASSSASRPAKLLVPSPGGSTSGRDIKAGVAAGLAAAAPDTSAPRWRR